MSARCKKCNSNGYNFGNYCDCYVVTEREYIENLKARIAELEAENRKVKTDLETWKHLHINLSKEYVQLVDEITQSEEQ